MSDAGAARQSREPDWLTVDEARSMILSRMRVLETESAPIVEALGRVLAESVESTISHPAWDNSAMDGYAVRSQDVASASSENPAVLRLIEDVPAGRFPTRSVGSGEAIKVMTGAPVPDGADGVTRLEYTEQSSDPDTIKIVDSGDAGRNIRRKGEDLEAGDRPLQAGTHLRPAEIGILAMMGRSEAVVYRRPKVGILSTGDEIADFDELALVEAGVKIMNSNSYALAAQVIETGGQPVLLGIARDNRESLEERLAAAAGCDALITSAGLAVGEHDYVKEVLDDSGMEFLFYRVRMRPGSPFTFGLLGEMPVFALPGNPVSAMVTFEVLVRPALKKMLGSPNPLRRWRKVTLAEPAASRGWLTHFYRAFLEPGEGDRWQARLTGPQGSGILSSMVLADALIRVPPDTQLPAGAEVEALFLREL